MADGDTPLQLLFSVSLILLLHGKTSTHGVPNGCIPRLGSCMEGRSRVERTSGRESMQMRCTVRSCEVSLTHGAAKRTSKYTTPCESGSTERW